MFDQLERFKKKGHFFLNQDEALETVCNAPKSGVGVYTIYQLKDGRVSLVYIGASGGILQNGKKNANPLGIWDSIVNGIQFGEPRRKSWAAKLKAENIDALDIYWFETFDKKHSDIPMYVAAHCLQFHFDLFDVLPQWNDEF